MSGDTSTITTIAVIAGTVHASCWTGLAGTLVLRFWGVEIDRRLPIALVVAMTMTAGAQVFLDSRLAR